MNFDSFVGNKSAVRAVRMAAENGGTGHAWLFCGEAGTGKKTLASLFAQALLCGGGEAKPCGRCGACLKFLKGAHPDISVIRKPADKSFILVEQIRKVREEIYIRPNESEYKIVLIENADNMNPAAANALLKVLEEPPAYAVFLLTADNERKLPETIVSRCRTVELFAVPLPEAKDWLSRRMPGADPAELSAAVLYGGGNLGRSLGFLEDATVRRGYEQALELARALTTRREFDVLEALAPFEGDRSGLLRLMEDFDRLLGRVAACKFRTGQTDPDAEALSARISPLRAAALHDTLDELRSALFYNANCALTAALLGARLKTVMETV